MRLKKYIGSFPVKGLRQVVLDAKRLVLLSGLLLSLAAVPEAGAGFRSDAGAAATRGGEPVPVTSTSSIGRDEGQHPVPRGKRKSDELLVKFKARAGDQGRKNLHAKHGSQLLRDFRRLNLHHVRLKKGLSVDEAIRLYRSDPDVEYAEPNYQLNMQAEPNDEFYANLWGMVKINAPAAWNSTTGSSDVVVAIIDTGIDPGHPDLAANVWTNTKEIAGNGVDDDGNGYIDDIHGINAITGSGNPMDDHGHGTHVAGTIGGVGNNGIGVVGVNWQVRVIGCKFLGNTGSGYTDGAIACLQYVNGLKEGGVNIVATNNSWGGGDFSQALKDAIAAQGDILFIAAAGNSTNDNDTSASYPASYDLPNIIAVAATDSSDKLASFSNYGRHSVHIGAPGVDIYSTLPAQNYWGMTGGYGYLRGTSMATPHVTGLAALLKGQDQNRDWRKLRNLIFSGGDPVAAMEGATVTGTRINANGSVNCLDRPLLAVQKFPSVVAVGVQATLAVVSINCGDPAGPVAVQSARGDVITLRDDGVSPDQAAGDGVFTGTWTPSSSSDKITVSSPVGSLAFSVPPLGMKEFIPEASTRTSYRYRLEGLGGLDPYTWAIVSGNLPGGLVFNAAAGEISGDSRIFGSAIFSVRLTDSLGSDLTKSIVLHTDDSVAVEKRITTLDSAIGRKMIADAAGNLFVTGEYYGNGTIDLFLAKYDPSGNLAWFRTYDSGTDDRGFGIALDGAGNIYVAGNNGYWQDSSRNHLLVKYDPAGNLLWAKAFDRGGDDVAWGLAIDGSDHLYTVGTSRPTGTDRIVLSKYSLSGDEIWTKTYAAKEYNYAYAAAVDASGNIYVAGANADPVSVGGGYSYYYDYLVLKYDPDGNLLWSRNRDCGSQSDFARGIAVDNAGNVYVTGEVQGDTQQGVTLKYDSSGNEIWSRAYPEEVGFYGHDLALDSRGNVLVTGDLRYDGASDYLTLKYDPAGNLLWTKHFNSGKTEDARAVAVGADGTIYVTGGLTEGSSYKALTIAYTEFGLKVTRPGSLFATVGTPYSKTLAVSDGTAPYSWSVTGGVLPPGVNLTADGTITGTPIVAGRYTFTIKATDPNSLMGSRDVTMTVSDPPVLAADFNASPLSGQAPLLVGFTDASTGGPSAWSWDFGDGSAGTIQNPSHVYATPGSYTVTLTATAGSLSNTRTRTGYVVVDACGNGPVRSRGSFYSLIRDAYAAATDDDVIELQALNFSDDLLLDRDLRVTLKGGFDCGFSGNPAATALSGNLRISGGTVKVEGLRMR